MCAEKGINADELKILENETDTDAEGNLYLLTTQLINPKTKDRNQYIYAAKGDYPKVQTDKTTISLVVSWDDGADALDFATQLVEFKNNEWKKI